MDYGEHVKIDLQFQPHLQSNDLPGRGVLEEAAKSKARLLTDIQFLDKEIQALQKRRDAVKDELWAFDCILAPIRRLSDDVLAEIFCHCIPTTRNARPFVSEAPLLLTLMCKKWRTIAMSTPRLWTTLHIPLVFNYSPRVQSPNGSAHYGFELDGPIPADLPHSALYAARDAGLDQWLSMSASLLLSISLYHPMSAGALPSSNLRRPIIDLITKYADRISALEADVPQKVVNELGKAITQYFDFDTLPRLQRLRLSSQQFMDRELFFGPEPTDMPTAQSLIFFSSAKLLRHLSLRINPRDTISNALTHTSPNLTTLLIHEAISVHIACNALHRFQQLEQCHLTVSDRRSLSTMPPLVSESPLGSSSPLYISLPNLHTISITGTLSDVQRLCKPLDLPSLSTLHLHIEYDSTSPPQQVPVRLFASRSDTFLPYPPESTEQLCAFLTQCTSLRSLSIVPSHIQAAELQSILSAVPQLKHLALNNTQSARPGTQIRDRARTTQLPLGSLKYSLDPLLRQQRVLSDSGKQCATLDTPLLPSLCSFEWHQFSKKIPIRHFVSFIINRLSPSTRPSAGVGAVHSHISDSEARQALTASLKDIKIRLLNASDVDDVESRIIQHAETEGLKRGADFHLDVALCPSVVPSMPDGPRYIFSEGHAREIPVYITEDHLVVDQDVTWPWVEF